MAQKKEYHKSNRIATNMYGTAGSDAVYVGMAVCSTDGSGS